MNELLFPIAGTLLVFFVLVPLFTLLARGLLALLPVTQNHISTHESPWRFFLTIGPTLGPILWLISASIHQSEGEAPLAACVIDHLGGELCRDVAIFGVVLFSILGYSIFRRVHTTGKTLDLRNRKPSEDTTALDRVHAICLQNLTLRAFMHRIQVVDCGLAPACTHGLFRPHVELETSLVSRLNDKELEATLLHEVEHAQARDPLRFFVAQVALCINPLGKLLAAELARYHFAREALCDKRAVQHGADPLALARSIVSVATPTSTPAAVTSLGGHGIDGVRLRVQFLLGYAASKPGPAQQCPSVKVVTFLIMLLVLWPHILGAGPLDMLHANIERFALILGLG